MESYQTRVAKKASWICFLSSNISHREIFILCRKIRHTIKPGTPKQRTTEHGTPAEHRISGGILDGTPGHWRNSGTLAEQSKYHKKTEQENTSIATEQQNNIKKYYQYRTTTYWADNITQHWTKQECYFSQKDIYSNVTLSGDSFNVIHLRKKMKSRLFTQECKNILKLKLFS